MVRIWHPWDKWECFKAGFYDRSPPKGIDKEKALEMYAEFLRDTPRFQAAIKRVFAEWPTSCEHFLTNEDINRIAWVGQSSMCIETGVSSFYRAGFKLLTSGEQRIANATAQTAISRWEQQFNMQIGLW